MSKSYFSFLILGIILFTNPLKANDPSTVNYFPLTVGNYYSYLVTSRSGSSVNYYMQRSEITKDTIINSKKYFFLSDFPDNYSNIWARMDIISGSLYKFDETNSCSYYPFEMLLDSFAAGINDTIGNCSLPFVCTDTSDITVFNTYQSKNITFVYYFLGGPGGPVMARSFANNFGMMSFGEGYSFGSVNYALKGCRINGVVYGDTSAVIGINIISTEIPAFFKLYQNYPNPFNPSTKVKFDIRKNSNVNLSVYDVLGNVIETLVNENLSAGSFSVSWNGNNHSNGIYFFRMIIDGKISGAKKMILLK